MRTKLFLFTLLAASLTIYSCKKDSDSTASSRPLIQKVIDNTDQTYVNLEYDGSRLKKMVADDNSYMTLEYASSTVTEKEYTSTNVLQYSTVYTLNSKGLAISSTYTANGKKSNALPKNLLSKLLPFKSTNATTSTYEYDANGYMTKMISNVGDANQEIMIFTISNGNKVGNSYTSTDGTFNLVSQFLTDKTNTTGAENMGLTFMGHQDKNLVLSTSTTYIGYTFTQTMAYEYDSQNRVTKATTTSNGTISANSSYTYK